MRRPILALLLLSVAVARAEEPRPLLEEVAADRQVERGLHRRDDTLFAPAGAGIIKLRPGSCV